MAPLPVEPKDGEHLSWLFGVLTALGGLFFGFKRVRSEVREIAKEAAEEVVDGRLETHVKDKHDPTVESLHRIETGLADIRARLEERHEALRERVEVIETLVREGVGKP